nr:LysR family transcriptional regulator substrate-binding protein [Bacillus pseudomycoides]
MNPNKTRNRANPAKAEPPKTAIPISPAKAVAISKIDQAVAATIHTNFGPFLSKKIRYFQENYPNVNLKIWEGGPLYLIEQLENRNIELAVLRTPFNKKAFSSICVSKEPFVLVMPAKWELHHSNLPISITKLDHIPLLLLHKDKEDSYHQLVIDECSRHGIKLNIACECPDSAFVLMLIMAGIGASILPKSAVSYIPQEFIRIVDLIDFPFQSESSIIWLKDRKLSNSARRFIECT